MSGDDTNRTTPEALAFWDPRGSAADIAWDAWRRNLEAVKSDLDEWQAQSAAIKARFLAQKAEADRQVTEAEAKLARLQAEVERSAEARLVDDAARAYRRRTRGGVSLQ